MKFNTLSSLFLSLLLLSSTISCSSTDKKETPSESEWITLFNGENFDGWKEYNSDTINPKWKVEDGMIIVSREGDAIRKNTGFGRSIITTQTFGNFELQLDYKMSPGGNSGILYHVIEDTAYTSDYFTGPEFQLLDDVDSPTESLPHRMTAANYDMFAPDTTVKTLNPPGEWNSVKLIYNNGHVEHWLNGAKVLEFEEGSDAWNAAKANSKWVNYPDWSTFKEGHIGLQDHGDFVAFKNIRIREL